MYKSRTSNWLKHIDFIAADLSLMMGAFLLVGFLRAGDPGSFVKDGYLALALFSGLFDATAIAFRQQYNTILKKFWQDNIREVIVSTISVLLFLLFFLVFSNLDIARMRPVLPRAAILYCASDAAFVTLWKKHLLKSAGKKDKAKERAIFVITEKDLVCSVLEDFNRTHMVSDFITGVCVVDASMTGQLIGNTAIAASGSDVLTYLANRYVDEVIIVASGRFNYSQIVTGLKDMAITLHLKTQYDFFDSDDSLIYEYIGPYLCATYAVRVPSPGERFLKRAMDIAGGLVGCIFAGIFYITIGPIIYLKSPGPIIYASERIGQNGKTFKFYKFRSMVMNADKLKDQLQAQNRVKGGMMFKIENDPRIIPGIGNFIRKTSIDEFPQFFNVLKGDMSLVGTRPPTKDEWIRYRGGHRSRLAVRPGITGMWQTSGRSNITDFEQVVELDRYYVNHWSLGLDIKLLFKTVIQVFRHEGSM